MKDGKKWVTSPFDVAKEISKSLAANALISQVNGVLWDMTRPLEGDCELKLFTFDSDEGRDTFWHSSAHILPTTDACLVSSSFFSSASLSLTSSMYCFSYLIVTHNQVN